MVLAMYRRDKTLQLLTSASATPNNLAIAVRHNGKPESIGVIHQGFINVAPLVEDEPTAKFIPCSDSALRQSATVTQVLWCTLGHERVLAIASSQGLQIFDAAGLECLFSHSCEDLTPAPEHFARGLATVFDQYLCVGNAGGCVRVFAALEGELVFLDRKTAHDTAISDLAAVGDVVASCDEAGSVVLWALAPDELVHTHTIPSYGSACTSVKLLSGLVAVAYGSGTIRLFSLPKPPQQVKPVKAGAVLLCEVAAHARWITGLDAAPMADLLLSVSEDSFVRVWHVLRGNSTVITQKFFAQVEDSFLVGGRFLSADGSAFCVSAYDSNLVQCYKT